MQIGFSSRYANVTTNDFRHFGLLDPIDYVSRAGQTFRMTRGAQTDLASIPSPLWSVLAPAGGDYQGDYALPALLHDCAYRNTLLLVAADGSTTKAALPKVNCDNLLKESMESVGVPPEVVTAIYDGVALAGQSSFVFDR